MGKATISMAIFHSYVKLPERVLMFCWWFVQIMAPLLWPFRSRILVLTHCFTTNSKGSPARRVCTCAEDVKFLQRPLEFIEAASQLHEKQAGNSTVHVRWSQTSEMQYRARRFWHSPPISELRMSWLGMTIQAVYMVDRFWQGQTADGQPVSKVNLGAACSRAELVRVYTCRHLGFSKIRWELPLTFPAESSRTIPSKAQAKVPKQLLQNAPGKFPQMPWKHYGSHGSAKNDNCRNRFWSSLTRCPREVTSLAAVGSGSIVWTAQGRSARGFWEISCIWVLVWNSLWRSFKILGHWGDIVLAFGTWLDCWAILATWSWDRAFCRA